MPAKDHSERVRISRRPPALARFERQVDPDGALDPAERARRAAEARSAYFSDMARRSAAVRSVTTTPFPKVTISVETDESYAKTVVTEFESRDSDRPIAARLAKAIYEIAEQLHEPQVDRIAEAVRAAVANL